MAVVGSLSVFELPNGDGYKLEDSALRDSVAEEFDSTKAYNTNDYVLYEGQLYKFKADKTAGAWDSTKVDATTVVAEMVDGADASKADKVDLAPTFDTATAYEVGDLVIYENVLYRCKAAHAAGAWAAADFEATKISQNIKHYDFSVSGSTLTISEVSV